MYRKPWILCAGWALASFACGSGESGLVLGLPARSGGSGGATIGGSPEAGDGDGGTAAGSVGQAGAAGEPAGASGDPPWVAERCTPAISFENRDPNGDGQAFMKAVPDPTVVMWQATRAVCRTLFRSGAEVPPVRAIALSVGAFDGVAGTGDGSIILSAPYLKMQADAGQDVLAEISGILHFQTSFLYQNPGRSADAAATRWLLFGIADFVRLKAGYLDRASRSKPTAPYDQSGSRAIAFFLDYVSEANADVVYQLNRSLAPTADAWSKDVFTTLTGSDLDSLWAAYLQTF